MVYLTRRMALPLVRLVATLMLTGQLLPVGLTLLCDQVQRGRPTDCSQPMPSHSSAASVDVTPPATLCVNSALCATMATAVIALGAPIGVSAKEYHLVAFAVPSFAPADPQPPLPPPPLA